MTTAQKTAFIEGIYRVFSEQGVVFSDTPEDRRAAA